MQLRSAFLAAGTAVTLVCPKELPAQSENAAAVGAGLEEVIVTARRREEALQDVPISVSALSGEALERAGISDIQALQYRTPSLAVTTTFSQRNVAAFALRGQRTQETQLFTDPPVGTYFAEVVQPHLIVLDIGLPDIDGLDVLQRMLGARGTEHQPSFGAEQTAQRGDGRIERSVRGAQKSDVLRRQMRQRQHRGQHRALEQARPEQRRVRQEGELLGEDGAGVAGDPAVAAVGEEELLLARRAQANALDRLGARGAERALRRLREVEVPPGCYYLRAVWSFSIGWGCDDRCLRCSRTRRDRRSNSYGESGTRRPN